MAVEVSLNSKFFDCQTCQHRNCDEDKKRDGSKGPATYDKFVISDPRLPKPIVSSVCFVPMITRESSLFLRYYKPYDKGVMLFSGGLLDQPAKYIAAMDLIETKVAEHYGNND